MSTYSPDLRIELITTGDQAGVWGNTTNNNLAYVVEQSVAGYVSVAVSSANQAFTYLNGGSPTAALNEAVHASIALTTSTGANFAVYAPPASKQYTIYNASSFTATIYNSTVIGNTTAAGTGVAIPAGQTVTVWSDGTNFRLQNTYLFSPLLGGVSTAATASSGTNTTQLATTAFVQAAVAGLPTLSAIYPVGSIYTSTVSTIPSTLFGFGTWSAFGAGRVLIGNGGGFTAGATGGSADATLVAHNHTFSGTTSGQSATHNHVINISDPGHQHTVAGDFGGGGGGYNGDGDQELTGAAVTNISASSNNASNDHSHTYSGTTSTPGSSATNANLQPYIVVYMWQRTA